jgi:SulP family sulfate permease
MCEWRHFVEICKTAPKSDILVLVITFVLTVVFDLVVAIEVGMIAAVVLFMRRMADVTKVRKWEKAGSDERYKKISDGIEVLEIDGPMFFATSDKFAALDIDEGVKVIILRMHDIPALDISAVRNLNAIYKSCSEKGIKLILSHVTEQPMSVIKKSGLYERIGSDNILENIDRALERAESIIADK